MAFAQAKSLIDSLRIGVSKATSTPDKTQLRKAAHQLAELCKQGVFIAPKHGRDPSAAL